MTSMLLEMKAGSVSQCQDVEEELLNTDPVDEILAAAKNIVGDPNSIPEKSDQDDDSQISDAIRSILEQTSPPLDFGENLQEVVSSSFSKITSPTSLTLMDDLKNRYKVPANCKQIGVAKVNPEIWSGLPQHIKARDAKAQHLQQHLSKALIAQAKTAEQILKIMSQTKDPSLQSVLQTLMDSAMSVGLGMKELNATRKQDLKSSLLPEYAGLSSGQLPVTEYLFGDNLESSLKLLKSTSKIVRAQVPQGRYHPYVRNPRKYNPNTSGNLNFRRQSFVRTPQMTGQFRQQPWRPNSPMLRPSFPNQHKFRKPGQQQ
jgi:hypothetical protein